MAKDTKLEWVDHTFNPWWGCEKVSQACKNCYAETWAKRVGSKVWGADADRRFFTDRHWRQPLKWDREAAEFGIRQRVFCASMADVFEDRRDLDPWRLRLADLIAVTPNLDWLLLTKRHDKISKLAPWKTWPKNVWLGITVENQQCAELRLPSLAKIPAAVRFLSCEPLLGPLDLTGWLGTTIDWVVTGGESGPKARPSHPDWFRSLRDQCLEKNVAFHFRKWGHWSPYPPEKLGRKKQYHFVDAAKQSRTMWAVGMHQSGRELDGRIWEQTPFRPLIGK